MTHAYQYFTKLTYFKLKFCTNFRAMYILLFIVLNFVYYVHYANSNIVTCPCTMFDKINDWLIEFIIFIHSYLQDGDIGEAEDKIRDDEELEADEERVEEQGKFERAYNFRFEEPDQEYVSIKITFTWIDQSWCLIIF